MKDWKSRLYTERAELLEKYRKLEHFIATAKLPKEDMNLLRDQYSAMADYLLILDKRIGRINDQDK